MCYSKEGCVDTDSPGGSVCYSKEGRVDTDSPGGSVGYSKEGRVDTDSIQNSSRFKHTWLHWKPTSQPRASRAPIIISSKKICTHSLTIDVFREAENPSVVVIGGESINDFLDVVHRLFMANSLWPKVAVPSIAAAKVVFGASEARETLFA